MKVMNVVGARPNFMKIAPIQRAMRAYGAPFQPILVHTGQHYDERMSKFFFSDLLLPEPGVYLGVGSGSHAKQTAAVMVEFEKACSTYRPDLVVVVGDVNSTLACSLVCAKLRIPVAHVEAGLRSFDRTMPEEVNRIVTDSVSDILFVTEESAVKNLTREGIPEPRIHFVGNVMIDSIKLFSGNLRQGVKSISLDGLTPGGYAVLTLHRPGNVDDEATLTVIASILEKTQEVIHIAFPVHPRTLQSLDRLHLLGRLRALPGLHLLDPLGYVEFIRLMVSAKFVMTDSGGIQEETTFFGIPCLTLRDNTERPSTVEVGTNRLVGTDPDVIEKSIQEIMSGKWKKGVVPPLWDGHASERIVKALVQWGKASGLSGSS
jgi:UDP-N-acetylglucosamine 2-epimerase (non-hydrolysing)